MADILDRILAAKRREVDDLRERTSLEHIEERARAAPPPRGFEAALRRRIETGRPAVIAEIKRASPSHGVMRAYLEPGRLAAIYEENGATCLSVLTDREFFGGSAEDLRAAREACVLPVLRKDFIIDPWQVFESRAMGADCILLIVGSVPEAALCELEATARSFSMDVLVECHDAIELESALRLKSPLIGINNRDLRSFAIRLETTLELLPRVPSDRLVVTESGIGNSEDISRMFSGGVSAYLVGSALMEADDPGKELSRLFSVV